MNNYLKVLGLLAVLFIISCQEKKYGAFTVSGKVSHAMGKKIYLQELPFGSDQPIIIDSASFGKEGGFTLRGMGMEESLYRLVVEDGMDILLVNDSKSIKVGLDIKNYRNYQVEGSEASKSLHQLFEKYRQYDSSLYLSFKNIDSLQKLNNADSLLSIVKSKRDKELNSMNQLVVEFIKTSNSPAARYYALGMASRTLSQPELIALLNESVDKFKTHNGLAKLKSLMAAENSPKATPGSQLLDKQAPEINLPDPNGQMISLSSLKGKYVLVDFWASWCGPCRDENPTVVAAYQQFKNKNFTVLGVSFDDDKAAWLKAIKEDGLNWQQVSDLKKWESAMVPLYQIDGIPFNVLVDPNGKIIATGLRGQALIHKLAEVLK